MQSNSLWLMIDARLAETPVQSGIGRFVCEFTQACAAFLPQFPRYKILITTQGLPALWMQELVWKFPMQVFHWCNAENKVLPQIFNNKPRYRWSTQAYLHFFKYFPEKFLWISPGNYDYPSVGTEHFKNIIPIIHDAIPFLYPRHVGLLFGLQYRNRVRYCLRNFPFVCTVSESSAKHLQGVCKKRKNSLYVLGEGVASCFGAIPLPSLEECLKTRQHILDRLQIPQVSPHDVWLLGVGRSEPYKNWDLAIKAVRSNQKNLHNKKMWFFRIGTPPANIESQKHLDFARGFLVAEDYTVYLPHVDDADLALLYRLADRLLHPSLAEGFGLPPLEALLSGCPVLYQGGTAVDEHVPKGILPAQMWMRVENATEGEWSLALSQSLAESSELYELRQRFQKEPPRQVIESLVQRSYGWEVVAKKFFNMLESREKGEQT